MNWGPVADKVVGGDFAGTVEELGADVDSSVRFIGERVAGLVRGGRSTCSLLPYLHCTLNL